MSPRLEVLGLAPAITEIAAETRHVPVPEAARAFLAVGEQMRIADLAAKAAAIATPDHYDRLAIAQALSQLAASQAALTREADRCRRRPRMSRHGSRARVTGSARVTHHARGDRRRKHR